MKTYHEQLLIPDNETFLIKRNVAPYFTTVRHYHRELEIKLMVSGWGKGFIGETVYEYTTDDLVLVGPNLPHHWESGDHYQSKSILADCFYIQFKEDFLGSELYYKTDANAISEMFQNSRQGIRFKGQTVKVAKEIIFKLYGEKGFNRILSFLHLLKILSESFEFELLSNSGYLVQGREESDKLHKIYLYITKNYKYDVSLDTACQLVNMSKSSFCQYFKKRTLKSFTEFLNEVRINNAVKLLIETDKSIMEAAYESGFNNIGYFNRKFREIKGDNPGSFIRKLNKG